MERKYGHNNDQNIVCLLCRRAFTTVMVLYIYILLFIPDESWKRLKQGKSKLRLYYPTCELDRITRQILVLPRHLRSLLMAIHTS